ncbi:receptor-like cytosolic serine/threonine-protein kinase RBK1 isoform X1 [Rhododendron vialii]|uniref:receptor-like cytosolic serine/threonine-protein kinase RBK1 isoform X1 n=1 Tax=Rhododendron vialii TaxID=182163 RepID=UPI00266030D8|nr:receptor-like cytosolic serine/threonine-protein kinase RBK1 isoform X1 [Rhododendron vialii]
MEEEANENPDSESLNGTKKDAKIDDLSSPRGVLEAPVSGSSDSDNSSISSGSSSFDSSAAEKSPVENPLIGEISSNNVLHWKNLIENIKWKSVRRFSTIPLIGGYDLKNLRRKLGRNRSADEEIDCGDSVVPKPSWRNFSRSELSAATDNFSPEKLIGKGGHAEVYKGCLSDGQVVAVKRITKKDKKDEDRVGDFLSELGIIAHINHPNAAKLIGFSVDGGFHLVLQFSSHGSLASLLHGATECLEWKIRFKVALGVAEGLQYLHCECHRRIIHRDITASNILLTEDNEPQISDFGLAKWLPEKWIHHVVDPIEGTFGYMAPEYFMHGIVDEKTDVFAFGVLLLELITGRRAVDSFRQSLVMWAKPLLENNNIKDLADPKLGDAYDTSEMKRAVSTALSCLHHLPNMRPTMGRVVQILRAESSSGQTELKQKSLGGKAIIVDACDLEDYTCTNYLNDLNRHMQLVLE